MAATQWPKWEDEFAHAGAYWRHNGDPTRPHALLSSGKHSDGYLNCSAIVSRPQLLEQVCRALLERVPLRPAPDWVVGSAFGSILVAYQLAKLIKNCKIGFTERQGTQSLRLKRFEVECGEAVVVVTTTLNELDGVQPTLAALRVKHANVIAAATLMITDGTHRRGDFIVVAPSPSEVRRWLPPAATTEDSLRQLINVPTALEQACRPLAAMLRRQKPRWVIGAGTESIPTAFELAMQLDCLVGFTEPAQVAGKLRLERCTLKPTAPVLVCEDVLTTGGTTRKTIAAVVRAGGTVTDHLCAIANRSGSNQLDGREIVSLITPQFNVWEPAACPLCQAGSAALHTKGNWAQLTQAES